MDEEPNTNYDRKIERTKKIIVLVVAPILLASAGLIFLYDLNNIEEKTSYTQILSEIDLKCYNVNWFGTFGFQTTFLETIVDVGNKLDEYDMDFTSSDFFNNQEVIDYLIINCPHIDSRLQIPAEFDPFIGVPALDKCLEIKSGTFESEDYCLQFKS